MIARRSPSARAERAARRESRAATLRQLGDASSWLALPMTTAKKTPMKRRREDPRRSSFFVVPDYRAHLETLACEFGRYFGLGDCARAVVVHHQREGGGTSLRRPDTWGIPTCDRCHKHRHAHAGEFAGLGRPAVNNIERLIIAGLQERWFGRALRDADDLTVRAAVEAGRSTRGLFAATDPITAGAFGIHEAM